MLDNVHVWGIRWPKEGMKFKRVFFRPLGVNADLWNGALSCYSVHVLRNAHRTWMDARSQKGCKCTPDLSFSSLDALRNHSMRTAHDPYHHRSSTSLNNSL
ncbi:hypothetical protein TNCT_422341 [Trichonephila clavata]|uniref:Uncharacterized protein n=1 Tax=Trichonephila clavata TaxID=2740835 RepID=A0A8X6HLF7_TRICU|nr:hypothetical protein TNCT_422341 [Trichonephila clavata]